MAESRQYRPHVCCSKMQAHLAASAHRDGIVAYQEQKYRTDPLGRLRFDLYGCCGGGCFVLQDLRFCPWCARRLEPSEAVPGYTSRSKARPAAPGGP